MARRDDNLPSRLLYFEWSSRRHTETDSVYLRTQLSLINTEKHRLETDLCLLLANRLQPTKERHWLHRDGGVSSRPSSELNDVGVTGWELKFALLLANRSLLTKCIYRCQLVLTSYNKLPPDLIREVILLCLPDRFHSLPLWVGTKDFRLRITQVCAMWRRVAFSMPELWQVHLSNSDHTYKSSVNLVNAWFRQGSASNIGLTVTGAWKNTVSPKADPVLFFNIIFSKLVVPFSDRFKSLGPLLVNQLQWEMLFNLLFDELHTLSLNLQHLTRNNGSRRILSAPSLRDIRATHIPSIKLLSRLPLGQLTSITLSGSLTTGNLPEILAQCRLLQTCDLHQVQTSGSSPPNNEGSIVLPNLTSLTITFVSARTLGWLSTFTTPKLSSLVLSALPNTPQSLEEFIRYIASISQTLRCFEVRKVSENDRYSLDIATFDSILQAMPLIKNVFLPEEYAISLPTLDRIGTGELVPNIEHIEFTSIGPVSMAVDLLVPAQSIRPSSLKKVRIHRLIFGLGLDPPRVQELRGEGLDIRLETLW